MALAAGTIWEVRTTGAATNGGAFNPLNAVPGVDRSQQDSSQFTYTDLVISGSTLTSAAFPFSSAERANVINITGGTGFTTGRYEILSVSGVTATLDRSPGTNGSTGGAGKLGGAVTDLATVGAAVVPGNTVYIKTSGGYSISTGLTFATAGTDGFPISWIGYSSSRTDGLQAVLTWTGAGGGVVATFSGADQIIRNLAIVGNANTDRGLIVTGQACRVWNCSASGCQLSGISLTGVEVHGHRCTATTCGTASAGTTGFNMGSSAIAYDCRSFSNTGNGFASSNADGQCIRCDAYLNTKSGFYCFGSGSLALFNCVASGNTLDGWRFDSSSGFDKSASYNGAFTGNAAWGVNYLSSDVSGATALGLAAWVNNAYFGNGSGARRQVPAGSGDITLTADPWTSAAVGNFAPNTTAGGGAALRAAGYPGGYGLTSSPATQIGYLDVGSVQSQAASTAGTVFNQGAPTTDPVRFPDQISRGMQGGPQYSTVVVVTGGGSEQRVGLWALPRYRWEVNNTPKSPSEMNEIIAFFHARQGRQRAFLFKDWGDFTATDQALTVTGGPTVQLAKNYVSGSQTLIRPIYKPTATPAVTLKRNASPFLAFSVDTTTGLVTFTPDSTATITAITKAANALVTTSAAHGFTVGQTIYFSGVAGMTSINGLTGVVQTTPLTTTFTVNINSTNFSTYTSGGIASKYLQPTDVLTWSGQFDCPVRFDTDELRVSFDDPTSWSLDGLPILEIRA
jgi:uncharacterized protein (TIGR02217 family)